MTAPLAIDTSFPFETRELARVPVPPRPEFEREILRARRPVVLTGMTRDWLPAEEWTLSRVAARWGEARVIAARLARGVLAEAARSGVVFEKIRLADFVTALAADPAPAAHYVMAPTWNFPDDLQQAYRTPDICAGAPHLQAKVWLGKAGTVTPVHRDVPHNLHVHLHGRKRWLLFAPRESGKLYPRGIFSGMPNFAHVDPEHLDLQRHPRARDLVAWSATLGPGETLFVPHGWWHHARTLEDATAINFWWATGPLYLATLASSAFKRLRRIRHDEWG